MKKKKREKIMKEDRSIKNQVKLFILITVLLVVLLLSSSSTSLRFRTFESTFSRSNDECFSRFAMKNITIPTPSVLPSYEQIGEYSKSQRLKQVCGSILVDRSCSVKLLNDAIERRNYPHVSTFSLTTNCTASLLLPERSIVDLDNITDVIMCAFVGSDEDSDEERRHDLGGTLYSIFVKLAAKHNPMSTEHRLTSWILYLSIFDWTGPLFGDLLHGSMKSLLVTEYDEYNNITQRIERLPHSSDLFVTTNFAHGLGHGLGSLVLKNKLQRDQVTALIENVISPLPLIVQDDLFRYVFYHSIIRYHHHHHHTFFKCLGT